MIGQEQLIKQIDNLIENNRFPRFAIICGVAGSGKKELCKYIAERLNVFWCYESDCKVETVRKAILDAYKVSSPTLYAFTDADDMSIQAKNSLLKVTEEPPNKAYFLMTLENINNTLPTIRSRATILNMESYTVNNIKTFANELTKDTQKIDILAELCETPGEVKYINSVGINDFSGFVNKVFDNIAAVNGSNAFKIGANLCLKESNTGYDLKLFLRAFKGLCWKQYLKDKNVTYLKGLQITEKALKKCSFKSVNRQMVFDIWVLEIRGAWM